MSKHVEYLTIYDGAGNIIYQIPLNVPDGYTLENNEYVLGDIKVSNRTTPTRTNEQSIEELAKERRQREAKVYGTWASHCRHAALSRILSGEDVAPYCFHRAVNRVAVSRKALTLDFDGTYERAYMALNPYEEKEPIEIDRENEYAVIFRRVR